MMKQKKLLALLLAVCMVLALLPSFATAETTEVTDELTRDKTGVTGTSYVNWTYTSEASGITYAGYSAGGSSSIQLNSKNNYGIVTTVSGGKATKVAVTWSDNTSADRTLDVYGKSTAYSATSDLYGSNPGTKIGSIVCGTSTTLTIEDEYTYIGLRSNSGAMYLTEIDITWEVDGDAPQPTTYTVSFDANGGTGTMADVTTASPYTLPNCAFTAPEGQEFDYWAVDGDEGMYDPGDEYELTGDTTFVAQWKDLPVPTYTDMMLKRVPSNGDVVVIYYPTASKVMTGTDYLYNNKKHELVAVDATLTDDVLAVPDEALRLTVITTVADDGETTLYTFETEDGKYLLADGTNVQLVDEQGANTLFRLETAAAGTDNWYIKCDSATYGGNAQYIEYYNGYFSVYSLGTNTGIFTFQFFAENGEGPTPPVYCIVTLDPGEAGGDPVVIEDATSPYTLPECPFTAPEGMAFNGWTMAGGDGTVYKAGAQVTLEELNVTFIARWKELVTKNYTLVTSEDELSADDTVIVVGVYDNKAYALAQQWSSNRRAVGIELDGDQAVVDVDLIATEKVDDYLVRELTIGGNADDGWTFLDPLEGGYLYAASSSANWMKTQETNDNNGVFALTFGEGGAIIAAAKGTNTNKYFRFNKDGIFSCYSENSSVQNPIYLYKYVEEEPVELEDGFYLIGPNWTVDAIDANNMFGENVNAGGEYVLAATLAAGDEIKVVKVANGAITAWYPDGEGTQYTVDAAHAGSVNIYFRETYNSDWSAFGGYFYIEAGYNITCVSGENGLVSTTHSRAAAGTTVTIYLEAEDDYEVETLTVMCGETEVETNKVNNWQYTFTMPAGDVTITATFAIPVTEPSFKAQSLTLDGMIGVNFRMDLPEISGVDYSTSFMTFAVPHGECTEQEAYDEDDLFTCYVTAVQMAEPITATFHYTQNGAEKTIEKVYSVEDYFTAFDEVADQYDDTTVALVLAVANYGYYAQHFLAEQKGWTFGTDYVEMETVYPASYDVDAIKTAVADDAIVRETNADVTKVTYSLILDSATEIRVFFKTVSGYTGEFAMNEPYTATKVGARYQVSVLNIPAHQLTEKHTIIATTDDGQAKVVVSAMSYVKSMLDAYTDATSQNAAAALYVYAQAANAYHAAH